MERMVTDDDLDTNLINFSSSEISVCHPVAALNRKRFVSRQSVRKVFAIKKYPKHSKVYQGVFIVEDLSPLRMKLLILVKKKSGLTGVHNEME